MNETLRHSYKLSRNFEELNLTCLIYTTRNMYIETESNIQKFPEQMKNIQKFFISELKTLLSQQTKKLNKLNRTQLMTNKFKCIKCRSLREDPCINRSFWCQSMVYVFKTSYYIYHTYKRRASQDPLRGGSSLEPGKKGSLMSPH